MVNNFSPHFSKILRSAGVKEGEFHDLRRTAICTGRSLSIVANTYFLESDYRFCSKNAHRAIFFWIFQLERGTRGIFLAVDLHAQAIPAVARPVGSSSIRQPAAEFDDRPTQFRRRRRNLVSEVELSHFVANNIFVDPVGKPFLFFN